MLISMVMNGFWVATEKQANVCKRQGCQVAGNQVRSVFPPVGVWLNLPFEVNIYGGASLGRRFRLVRKIVLDRQGTVSAPAQWEIPD